MPAVLHEAVLPGQQGKDDVATTRETEEDITEEEGGPANLSKGLALFSAVSGRASPEDLAAELTAGLAGAKGIAMLICEMIKSSSTRPAQRIKLLQQVITYLERVGKHYGDMAKLKAMPTDEVEKKMVALLNKHSNIFPIEGVTIHGQGNGVRGSVESGEGPVGSPETADRAPEPEHSTAGDMDTA